MNICHHVLTSSTQLQNKSFHVVERTRTSLKCQKMKNARAKRAKLLFFIVNYANLWGFCCRRRRGCLSSLILTQSPMTTMNYSKGLPKNRLPPKKLYNLGVYTHIANTLFIFIHTASMCSAILVYFFVFSSCSLSKITQNGA